MTFYNYELTVGNLLKWGANNFPRQEIVYRNVRRYTFEEFYDNVLRFSSGLMKAGVKPGDRVAVIDWDTDVYMQAYYAVPSIGAVLHTVNIRYPPELILRTMLHAEDKWVIVRDEFLPIIERAKDFFSPIKGWIVYSDSREPVKSALENAIQYADLIKSEPAELPNIRENTQATLFYTSGTTGDPKGVWFTHRDLVLHCMSGALVGTREPLNYNSRDVTMILVPMFHVHAWGYPYSTLLSGSKYVLPGRYEPKTILELIKNEGVTFSAMVPTILYMIMSHPDAPLYAEYLKRWRVVIGGSALPEGLASKAEEMGIKVVSGYGLSETAPILTVSIYSPEVLGLSEEEKFRVRLKAGIPIPFVDLRVVNENWQDVPHDGKTIGRVVARAPWLTREYYKDPEKTAKLWENDWLNTGDLGVVDRYGYLTIVDRDKDAIKSGGEFIPSLLLENVISVYPKIGEVAVVGVKHEKWGERPVAFVTTKGTTTEEEVLNFLRSQVAQGKIQKWWIPDRIIIIDEMPKTSTNKIDKKVLREKAAIS